MFYMMSALPNDEVSAWAFTLATTGFALKEIASMCGVAPSLVWKWQHLGNVPSARVAMLHPDMQRRYQELMAKRAGALVIERDLVQAIADFVGALRPSAVKASLESVSAGSSCGQMERRRLA